MVLNLAVFGHVNEQEKPPLGVSRAGLREQVKLIS